MSRVVRSILDGSLRLTSVRAIVLALGAAQGIILAKLLGPTGFGEVNLYSMIFLYVGLTGFGLDTIAAREIPGRLVANDENRCQLLKDMAFTYETGLRLVICAVVALIGLIVFSGAMSLGIVLIAAVLLVSKVQGFYYAMGGATKQFVALSRGTLIDGLLMFLLTVTLIKFTGAYTQLAAMFGTSACLIYFLAKNLDLKVRLRFDREAFVSLSRNGMHFVVLGIAFYFWRNSDRTMVAAFLDLKMLGMYAFGASCAQLLLVMSNECHTVFEPFVYERTAAAKSRPEFYRLMYMPSLVLGYLAPLVLAFVWIVYPVVIHWLMPEYADSIWPFRILAVQVYLANLGAMATYLLRSPEINRQSELSLSYLIAGCLSYVFMWIFLQAGWGLIGVAMGFVLARFVVVIQNFLQVQRYYLKNWREAGIYYKRLLSPILALAVFFGCVAWIEEFRLVPEGWTVMVSAVAFLVTGGMLLWMLDRKVGIVTEVGGMLREGWEAHRGVFFR